MVKGQRKRDEEAGVHEGVAGKRQWKMASSWWALTLSLCRGRGAESKSLAERSGEEIRWPRWLHLHLVWVDCSQTGRMILSPSAEYLYHDARRYGYPGF